MLEILQHRVVAKASVEELKKKTISTQRPLNSTAVMPDIMFLAPQLGIILGDDRWMHREDWSLLANVVNSPWTRASVSAHWWVVLGEEEEGGGGQLILLGGGSQGQNGFLWLTAISIPIAAAPSFRSLHPGVGEMEGTDAAPSDFASPLRECVIKHRLLILATQNPILQQ